MRVPDKISSPKVKLRSPRSPRTEPKSVHKVAELIESDVEEMHDTGVFATSYHKVRWYRANLRFPCPLVGHNHEISHVKSFSRSILWRGGIRWTRGSCVIPVYLPRMYA